MFTEQDYLYGWLAYIAGVVLVMGCGWILTAKIRWWFVRNLLRVLVGAALIVPWYANPELKFVAPAWIVACFEGLFEGDFWRAGAPLLAGIGVALAIYLIAAAVVLLVRKPAKQEHPQSTSQQTAQPEPAPE